MEFKEHLKRAEELLEEAEQLRKQEYSVIALEKFANEKMETRANLARAHIELAKELKCL